MGRDRLGLRRDRLGPLNMDLLGGWADLNRVVRKLKTPRRSRLGPGRSRLGPGRLYPFPSIL
ncbi:hypothetical protein LINPERPRIM_LOCUS16806 [Linum perenne]